MHLNPLAAVMAGLLGLALSSAHADDKVEHGFVARVYKSPEGEESKYVLFVPYDYEGDKPYPLLVSLHGDGERGIDGLKPSQHGLGAAIRKREKTFPFLTLFPQAHKAWVADSEDGLRTMAILADVQKDYRVDPRRITLTGMSSGGDGVFNFAVHDPDRWAAVAPVCGNGDPKDIGKIKDLPCWYFMGGADRKEWVDNAHTMTQALQDVGGAPIYTEYPGMGHGIWGKVYDSPELFDWLLKQHRQ